jgi:hypothetical protein
MGRLSLDADTIGGPRAQERAAMDYYAGLDVSMTETHICVVERDGAVVLEARASSTPEAIAAVLETAPACAKIVLETGRMAPMLFHGLAALRLPVIYIESRQAYQALKSLATHKTDRNDARGLAHLARTGFFKPVHVKSLPAHAVRALILARKKLVGQRVGEPDPRPSGGLWGSASPWAQSALDRAGDPSQPRDCRSVRCPAGPARGPQGRSGSSRGD